MMSQLLFPCSLSSPRPCPTAGKRTGERPNPNPACFSPIPKFRLAASSVSAGFREGNDGMPKHVAFIIDGHRKWGKRRGLTTQDGHRNGVMNFRNLVSDSSNLGIQILSLYLFSPENWNRSKMEVDYLLSLYDDFMRSDAPQLIARLDIRISVIGDKSRLPESLQTAISCVEEASHANKGMHLILALGYGGRNDIVEAAKQIAAKVEDGIVGRDEIDESMFEKHLMSHVVESPSPDLLIRAGGEFRLSNFYLWQLSYTEFYFTDVLFPDFRRPHLLQAIDSYRGRKRGYGSRSYEMHTCNN